MPSPLFDPRVPFPGCVFRALLQRAVDGDTVELLVDCGFSLTRTLHVRLAGIDAPELYAGTAETRARGRAAQAYLAQYEGRTVTLYSRQGKSFDRYVGAVFIDGRDVSALLLAEGLADLYPG